MVAGAAKRKVATPSTTAQPPQKKTIALSCASRTIARVFRLLQENNDKDDDNEETILVDSAGDEEDNDDNNFDAPTQHTLKKGVATSKLAKSSKFLISPRSKYKLITS